MPTHLCPALILEKGKVVGNSGVQSLRAWFSALTNKITCKILVAIAHSETPRRKKPISPALRISMEPKDEDLGDDVPFDFSNRQIFRFLQSVV